MADEFYWTMLDGTVVELKDMATSHIVNCIRMMERKVAELEVMELAAVMHPDHHSSDLYDAVTDLNTRLGKLNHSLLILRTEWAARAKVRKSALARIREMLDLE